MVDFIKENFATIMVICGPINLAFIIAFIVSDIRLSRKLKKAEKNCSEYLHERNKYEDQTTEKEQIISFLENDLKLLRRQRDKLEEEKSWMRDTFAQDVHRAYRALLKMQKRWIMHYKGYPIFRAGLKAMVSLNNEMFENGAITKNWPNGWVIENILIEVHKDGISQAWGLLDMHGKPIDFKKKDFAEWKEDA